MDKLARRVAADFKAFFDLYEQQLQPGAQPRLLYITCVDSRLDPEAMMGVSPGEMYVLRVPGGMVPAQGLGDVVVMGTVELALSTPSLKHIVVCGHTDCAFLYQVEEGVKGFELSGLSRLASMADYARAQAVTQFDRLKDPKGFHIALLEALIQRNLQALREIPIVKKREAAKEISLHGWYFDMTTGRLYIYDEPKHEFNYVQLDLPMPETPAPTMPQPQPTVTPSAPQVAQPIIPPLVSKSEPVTAPLTVAAAPQPVTPSVPAAPPVAATFTPPPPPVVRPVTLPPSPTAAESLQPQPIPSVAPPPVQVPHAQPVQRVYTSEVMSAAEQAAELPTPKATTPSSPVKDEFRTMFEAISSPLQRNRLRRRLNQLTTPIEWEAVAELLKEFNVPLVRQTLREISIELSNGEARSKLRNLLSQAASNGSSTGDWQQQLQKDFTDILQSLERKP